MLSRLRDGEKQLEHLKTEHTELEDRLRDGEKQLEDLKTETTELQVKLRAGKAALNQLRTDDDGVFTAPVRGLHFFSFTAADYLKGYMGLYLYRNNQPIIFNLDLTDHSGSTSNAMSLQLEEGDRLCLSMPASFRLYDDSQNFSVRPPTRLKLPN